MIFWRLKVICLRLLTLKEWGWRKYRKNKSLFIRRTRYNRQITTSLIVYQVLSVSPLSCFTAALISRYAGWGISRLSLCSGILRCTLSYNRGVLCLLWVVFFLVFDRRSINYSLSWFNRCWFPSGPAFPFGSRPKALLNSSFDLFTAREIENLESFWKLMRKSK